MSSYAPLEYDVKTGRKPTPNFTEHLLRNSASYYPNVLVAAPNGVTAYNVNGWTFHSFLNLDV